MASLGTEWGRVDLAALGSDAPAELINQLGVGQNMDPRVWLDILDEFMVPMAVWIDGDDRVRRITVDVAAAIRSLADEFDEDVPAEGAFSMTVDFTDYDDPSIEVAVPDPSQVVDITESLRATLGT